jgi:hypothetical protein
VIPHIIYVTYSRGLRLSPHARGLRLSTHARGLRLSPHARVLRLSTHARGLHPPTYIRGLSPSTYARGLRPSNYARWLCPSTYARGLGLPKLRCHNTRIQVWNRYVKEGCKETQLHNSQTMYKSSQHRGLAGPLLIALGNNLPCDKIGSLPAGGVVSNHIDSATRCLRQPFQELHVNLRIVDTHERTSHERTTSKMFAHKPVYGLSILEPAKQSRQPFRLIIQGKHDLVHNGKGSATGFG